MKIYAFKKIVLVLFLLLPVLLKAQIISTIAGNGTAGHLGDGSLATAAELNNPHGVFVDATGNIYIAETFGNYIRKINTAGVITTIAGNGAVGYTGDGLPATSATMNGPFTVTADAAGNVFFSDFYNSVVRKINTSGIISTVVGNGTAASFGDGGPAIAAELNGPSGLSFDGVGNLYIGEFNGQRVRKVNTLGMISTFAGNGTSGWLGDGIQATATELWNSNYVHATASGNVYITDNKNQRIRLVNGTTGIITTVAGNGTMGSSGDGSPATAAELNYPGNVNFDAAGNMYIAGDVTENIRIVNALGIINNYAGDGTAGFIDNVPATAGELFTPVDIAFDLSGNMIIADQENNRIRKISCIYAITAQPLNDTVFEGASAIYSVTTTMVSPAYQWQEDPGTGFVNLANVWPYSGVTTNTLTIHNASIYLNTTHYRCVVTNETLCPDTSAGAILIIKENSRVINVHAHNEIALYPNPATTALTIKAQNPINQITITNVLGQTIFSNEYNANTVQVNVAGLPTGVYFVKVNGNEVRKFVKE